MAVSVACKPYAINWFREECQLKLSNVRHDLRVLQQTSAKGSAWPSSGGHASKHVQMCAAVPERASWR
jgi:hypothetical protein